MLFSLNLPVVPVTRVRALALVAAGEPTLEGLCELAEVDPAVTAALLRVANSSYSSPVSRVDTARAALIRVGTEDAWKVVLRVVLADAFGGLARAHLDEPALWRHLVATALLADTIAWGEDRRSEAFTAGLLHDVGRLAMASAEPARYAKVVALARRDVPATEAERLLFGTDHADWGGQIGHAWGFPDPVVNAIADHHVGEGRGLAWVVAEARAHADALGLGDGVVASTARPAEEDAAVLPAIDALGGAEVLMRRVDWYAGVLGTAA